MEYQCLIQMSKQNKLSYLKSTLSLLDHNLQPQLNSNAGKILWYVAWKCKGGVGLYGNCGNFECS